MHWQPFKPVGDTLNQKAPVIDQCLLSQLVVGNNLLHLLMIAHNAVQSVSSDINQKCWRNLRSLKYLPQLINGQRVGTPWTDNGGEYPSNEFKAYLISKGACHELTLPYSPQQMEWLKEWIKPSWSQLDPWLLMQVYLIVGSSHSSIREESGAVNSNKRSSDSIQVMVWSTPNVGHLKVFGCIAYAHIPDQQRQNLDKKLKSCDLLAMIRNPKVTDWSMTKQWKLSYEEMLCLMKQSLTTVVK